MNKVTCVITLSLLACNPAAWAIPSSITYQGALKQSGLPASGNKNMLFRITNQDGTQVYWSSGNMSVPVSNGLFSAHVSPTGVDWQNVTPYIEASVEGQLLLPREPVNATVYASISNTIVDGAITPAKVASGYGLVASGTLVAYAGVNPPTGWLLCDGSAVSRTTYASLFSAIGTSWGAGDGGSTFNLPDFRRRVPVGSGGTGSSVLANTVGSTGGEETHSLTIGEIPAHNHGINDPGHAHAYSGGANAVVLLYSGGSYGALNGVQNGVIRTGVDSNTTGITIQNNGGGGAHNIMQPSAVVNFIIKI